MYYLRIKSKQIYIQIYTCNTYLPWLYGLNPLGVELKNPFGVGGFVMLRCIDADCDSPEIIFM